MATHPNFNKHTNQITVPQGRVFISTDETSSFLYVGATSSTMLNIEVDEIELDDGDSGQFQTLDSTTTKITRTVTFTGNDMNDDNIALLLTGEKNTITQASGTGLTFDITVSVLNSFHQIGTSETKPMGDTNITVTSLVHKASAAHATETDYLLGDQIVQDTHIYQCVLSGETGVSAPTWPATPNLGQEVTDGTVKWVYVGLKTLVADTHFYINEEKGIIRLLETAPVYTSKTTNPQAYVCTYSRAATVRNRVNPSLRGSIEGSLRLEQQNVKGQNKVWFFPRVSMKVSGELNLKSNEAAYQEFTVECKVLLPATGAPVYVDGSPILT